MAVLSFLCRRHRTPLFDWEDVDGHLRCRLPIAWIDQTAGVEAAPDFFQSHDARVAELALNATKDVHPGGPPLGAAFAGLGYLQNLFEPLAHDASDDSSQPLTESRWVEAAALARIALSLVEEAQPLFRWGLDPHGASESDWLGPGSIYGKVARHQKVYVRRRCASIAWRRYYWLFVVDRLSSRIDSEPLSGAPWCGCPDSWGTRTEIDLGRFQWLYEAEGRGGLETEPD
jgi:hypothetical protein